MLSSSCASIGAIAAYAESSPQSPALIKPDGIILTYKELWARILAVGGRLHEGGIGAQETVAILVPQGVLEVLAVAGVLNHCVCAPLQSKTTVAEVRAALGRLGATALIVSPEREAEAEAAISMGLTVLVAHNMECPGEWLIRRPASPPPVRANVSEAILLLITSATTGSSKLVPLTAVNLDAQTAPRSRLLRLNASDRMLQMTSLCHSMGIENTLAQFLAGGAVIATGGFDPTAYVGWLYELEPTWYDCAPTVHQAALAELKRTSLDRPISLRLVQSSGAPLPGEIRQDLEQILHIPVLNDYGMSETGPIATDAFLPRDRIPNSAGRSCGLEIAILNSFGEALLSNEEGEIAVRGPAVFSGYADDPDVNRTAFRNGWFCTGDVGRLDQEGNLFITGRIKEMINRGGEKISPAEVDAVLALHPAICEAASFAVSHPTLGEDVASAVVLRASGETPVSASELRAFAAQRLAAFKVPRRIYFVDEIPRGELGKPQRWLLTERLSGSQSAPPSPAEVTENRLADEVEYIPYKLHEIWARILECDNLGYDEDFFTAGGDSLMAITMLAEVDQRFGGQTSASAASFLDEPTLAHLADLVRDGPRALSSQNTSSEMRIFPVSELGLAKRLFCVPADEEEGLYFRRLARHLSGQIDVSIVRPANTRNCYSLFTFERAGEAMAKLIRQSQPEGPYLVGGFCYGGIVAVEAARNLVLHGQTVRVVLFDVMMPGFPSPFRGWRGWFKRVGFEWRAFREGNHLGAAKKLRGFRLRLAWFAIVPFRELLAPIEHVPFIRRVLGWAQRGYFPLYSARPIHAPILHFLSADEAEPINSLSRFGWRSVARRGIEERYLAFDHASILHESNLPEIVDTIQRWTGTSESGPNGT